SNSFTNLPQGTYSVLIKSSCTTKDTIITIGSPFVTQNIIASICQGSSYQLPNGSFVNSSGIYRVTISVKVGHSFRSKVGHYFKGQFEVSKIQFY
ncbi:MAG: hypothetical protein Q8N36_06630, partial [bacterium]|nr:hypothetical protein [bacterium]